MKKIYCLHLEIVNTSIQDWYNDIIDKFSRWVANDMKVESSDLELICKCTMDIKRKTIAENSIGLLQYMMEHSDSGKGKKDRIGKARDSLADFRDQTVYEKGVWLISKTNAFFSSYLIILNDPLSSKAIFKVTVMSASSSTIRILLILIFDFAYMFVVLTSFAST